IAGGTVTVTINQPGSYYLTGNITVSAGHGILLAGGADNVTLDLNGFTISSTANPAVGNGIAINQSVNLTIRNGNIRGSINYVGGGGDQYPGAGFQNGIGIVFTGFNINVAD